MQTRLLPKEITEIVAGASALNSIEVEKKMSSGKIVQVIGPVVDVEFSLDQSLPDINNALAVYKNDENKSKVVLEAALELGDGVIRTIAMESTDGLQRGMEVIDTGKAISVPVGKETLGRVFNVLGDTIDLETPFPEDAERSEIHKTPALTN